MRGVVAAGGKIAFVECLVGERAGNFRAADGEPEQGARFARAHAAAGAADDVAERDIFIVVGEALNDAVAACEDPASAERRRAGIELRLQRRRNGAHGSLLSLPSPLWGGWRAQRAGWGSESITTTPTPLISLRSMSDPPHKGEGCHALISTSGIFGMAPAAKAERST